MTVKHYAFSGSFYLHISGSDACEKAKCMTHYRLNTQREEEKKVEAQIYSLLKDEDNFKDPIISISNE